MKLTLHEVQLPLRHPFTTAHDTVRVQRSLIVELSDGGLSGFGEAPCFPYYGATIDTLTEAVESVRSDLERTGPVDPRRLWADLAPTFGRRSFAQCAVDQAAHDLWGRQRGLPLWRLWKADLAELPPSSHTIGIGALESMLATLREFDGWPIVKVKLGTEEDLARLRELRKHSGAIFRVDPNMAWSADQTIEYAPELRRLGVEFIEQPLPTGCWTEQRRVLRESALPIIADESCVTEDDVERCAGYFHGVNIKPAKCGGLTPALRMIRRARELGLRTMIGCMLESSVGISAAAQLLPLVDYADIDGATLLSGDVASGARLDKGWPVLPAGNGTGVTFYGHG